MKQLIMLIFGHIRKITVCNRVVNTSVFNQPEVNNTSFCFLAFQPFSLNVTVGPNYNPVVGGAVSYLCEAVGTHALENPVWYNQYGVPIGEKDEGKGLALSEIYELAALKQH